MHAGLALGEELLRASGSALLVVSRPGYGRIRVGAISAQEFAVVVGQLCDRLGIPTVEAVVGIPAGGRTAVEMTAHDPRRVRR
jgi:pimeloyl-ACP methyl ester carboxylesterase